MTIVAIDTETARPTFSVDPSAPFDSHAFYAGLRALNVEPHVRRWDGRLWEGRSVDQVGDVSELVAWANRGDPDMSLRKAYMRAAWARRPESELPVEYQSVPLGS